MSKIMEANTEPEILRTNLSSFIIMLKNIGIHNILSFDLMNVPPIPALSQGLETLYALGAIDEKTDLTKLGFKMSEFPTEPRLSRILLKSLDDGCSEEILCIVAAMQVRSLLHQPRTPKQQIDYDEAMEDIRDTQSDHVTYLNLMQMHQATPLNEEDCKEKFVNRMALKRACEIKSQLRNFLRKYGRVEGMDNGQSEDEISVKCRRVITSGLFSNTAKLGNDGRYYSLKGGHMVSISTASVLHKFGMGNEYILFSETYDGSRGGIEARGVSCIEAQWLRELAPHYFE
jgi:HrpA-like RNA helicase